MSAVTLVRTRLLALSPITAIVGSRISALVLPQDEDLPAIRLQQIGRDTPMTLRGSAGLVQAVVQVDCVAATLAAAEALIAAVRGTFSGGVATGLVGFKGVIGSTDVRAITPAGDERHLFDAQELKQVKATQDFAITFVSAT